MAAYDASVIRAFASGLYLRATLAALGWTLLGAGLGYFSGQLPIVRLPSADFSLGMMGLGAFIGYLIGSSRGAVLRMQAQTALCQATIEEHLRRLASVAPAAATSG